MANTYTLIASGTNSSDNVFVFDNIPQTYTDLVFRATLRTNSSNSMTQNVYPLVNNNYSNYSSTTLYGQGTDGGGYVRRTSEFNFSTEIYTNGNGTTANSFGSLEIYIPNYTLSNVKCGFADVVTETNSNGSAFRGMTSFLWNNTSAITRFDVAANLTGNYYLYGIKNS